ncbi:feec8d14-375c-4f64-9a7e-772cc1ddde62 [Sclerotinia trifoliorum]|uniref:Feec8d14-375c-4f64-9a7e-772cc1ddde62 n=1 Tax=Sclerotinia trifoliorum TaxID=28548 RepID=A0A8H2ZRS7_9HELO|nr:feec8d14-375c-4f64-9a7e-772cc1ddde62 [Sclerotinia trifoliorum]
MKAAIKLRKIVTKTTWVSRPIVWSTHRALNKNEGVWKSSRAGPLDWNEQLNGEFVDMIKKEWSQTIHVNMPTVVLQYVKEAEKCLANFADNLMSAALGISPSLREAFEYLGDSILRNVRRLQVRADSIFADFEAVAKDAWRLVKPICVDAWMPIYHICGAEKCRGHYARNKATHKIHVDGLGGRLMYRECGRKLEATLRRMCAYLHSQFEEKYPEVMEGFVNEMAATLDQHTMGGDRRSIRQKNSVTKAKLQGILPMKIEALYKEWQADLSNELKEDKKPEQDIFDST